MNSIDTNYFKKNIYIIKGDDYRNSYNNFKKKEIKYRRKIDLLRGHHFFGSHEYLRKNAINFTMLREPITRLTSLYNYLREIDFYEKINQDNMSLKEFLDSGLAMAADNGMTRLLTNNDFDKVPNGMITSDHAHQAVKNLDKYFVAIGITEYFEESLSLFKSKLGWKNIPHHSIDYKTTKKAIGKKYVKSFFREN